MPRTLLPSLSLWIEQAPAGPGVYLLAFYRSGAHIPYGSASPRGRALHYCGYADDIRRRLYQHVRGQGGRLCRAVALAGYELRLVRVWHGQGREYERALKARHRLAEVCPVCRYHLAPDVPPAPAPASSGDPLGLWCEEVRA